MADINPVKVDIISLNTGLDEHEGDLRHLIRAFYDESQYGGGDLDVDKALAHFKYFCAPTRCFYGAFDGDELVGFILGEVSSQLFDGTEVMYEGGYYVKPEYRDLGVGAKLLAELSEYAAVLGAAKIQLGATSGIDAEQTYAGLEKAGFQEVGRVFERNVR